MNARIFVKYTINILLIAYIITSLLVLLSHDRRNDDKNSSVRSKNTMMSKDAFVQKKLSTSPIGQPGKENNVMMKESEVKSTHYEEESTNENKNKGIRQNGESKITVNYYPKLTAYIEQIDQEEWKIKPLPRRTKTAQASKLKKVEYPSLNSCYNLPSQYPIDDKDDEEIKINPPTVQDPFLPWIHDVFPSSDGTFLHFVSQNKRRCHTGKNYMDTKIYYQPQVSLFQHVPIKRRDINGTTRYVLTSHEEADDDAIETRFICRFKDIVTKQTWETLSVFAFNYDYTTFRKAYITGFTYEGFDNHVIWTSQHLFNCPVPIELQDTIKNGKQFLPINDDYPTLFVDLIPIRTPPRYGSSMDFIPPRYGAHAIMFNTTEEFGDDHILPLIEDSGRLENIPICKPSLLTYRPDLVKQQKPTENKEQKSNTAMIPKNHQVIACTWAANSYKTRQSMTVGDGARRLHEWITFHLLTGFDHIYIYDNTHANDKNQSLEDVTNLFPKDKVTRINWPCKVCNNRPLNLDDKGERSSQYAAESSCRLRFGNNAEWLGSMDIDEYLVPLGTYTNIKNLVYDLHNEKGYKIFSFRSWRTRPIMSKLEKPKMEKCYERRTCFNPVVPKNTSFLDVYNCEQELPPKKMSNPAEKQIYKTDYVLLHYVHYSAVTTDLQLSREETEKRDDLKPFRQRFNDKKNHFFDEVNEATMIHTKAVPFEHTADYENVCKRQKSYFGFPWPNNVESTVNITNEDGYYYTCFINEYVRDYWLPKLHKNLGLPPS